MSEKPSKDEMLFNMKRIKKHLPFQIYEAICRLIESQAEPSEDKKKLLGQLGAMYAYAIAHMQEMGVSRKKREEFKHAHRQLRQLIEISESNEQWMILRGKEKDDFIRNLLSQAPMRKPKVDIEFVGKYVRKTGCHPLDLRNMLEEAGVEVEE